MTDFTDGIAYFGESLPEFEKHGGVPAIREGQVAILGSRDPSAVYQTLLLADALRYLTLQVTGSKGSGHPGGFASQAEAFAAFVMLGHKNLLTEVGHHAPGFYSSLFLDGSLEAMGIRTVREFCERFRERHGLLGHLSGCIPGVLAPAGPLGQGQHFAMAAALLHRKVLFPFTIGDGGLGEPYTMNSMAHFHTAYPQVTNFLPILVWNGFSQEHHSMVSALSNEEMAAFWESSGFREILLVDAKAFDDRGQAGNFVDSTLFSFGQRLAFTRAVLEAAEKAASSALDGKPTVLIIKQLKGSGAHATGAKSHNLYPKDTLDSPQISAALKLRALSPEAWRTVRANCVRAGGGPAARTVVTERELPLAELGPLPLVEYALGNENPRVPTAEAGRLAAAVGNADPGFIVTNADGNEASGMGNVNQALKIIHPTPDPLYHQDPGGQVYEPLSEDACAGLAAGLSLLGARALWCSYESFAVNGLPIWQTVAQAMAELRRTTPSSIALFTALALEQGRNGWTHQRPEIEAYLASLMRTGNVFPLFPVDANSIQVCFEWALSTRNKGVVITASKTSLPLRMTLDQTREALATGAAVLHESPGDRKIVFGVIGDLVLGTVLEAARELQARGIGTRVVSILNPRRLYRPQDVSWDNCKEPDGEFMTESQFSRIFDSDALLGVTGGASAMLEPLMQRSNCPREFFAWKRGETTASAAETLAFNGITADELVKCALRLLGRGLVALPGGRKAA